MRNTDHYNIINIKFEQTCKHINIDVSVNNNVIANNDYLHLLKYYHVVYGLYHFQACGLYRRPPCKDPHLSFP